MKPPSGRPHGAEQRGRGVYPVPRPHPAVPVAGAKLGWGGAGRALMAEWEAVLCFRGPGAGGASRACGVGRSRGVGRLAVGLAEAQESPSCSRLPRAAAGGVGGVGRVSSESVFERIQRCKQIALRYQWNYPTADCVSAYDSFLNENRWH